MAYREQFKPELPVITDVLDALNVTAPEGGEPTPDFSISSDDDDVLIEGINCRIQRSGLAVPGLSLGRLDDPDLRTAQALPLLYATYDGLMQQKPEVISEEVLQDARNVSGYATLLIEFLEQIQPGVIYAPTMLITARQSFAISALGLQRNRATAINSAEGLLESQTRLIAAHSVALGALAGVVDRMGQDLLERK